MTTIASPYTMSLYSDGEEGVVCYSPNTGEIASASSGDYWMLPFREPILDSEGEPMILARKVESFVDVLA